MDMLSIKHPTDRMDERAPVATKFQGYPMTRHGRIFQGNKVEE